jgi:hypothetical protein
MHVRAPGGQVESSRRNVAYPVLANLSHLKFVERRSGEKNRPGGHSRVQYKERPLSDGLYPYVQSLRVDP